MVKINVSSVLGANKLTSAISKQEELFNIVYHTAAYREHVIHECAVSMVTLCKTDDGELFMIHDNKETNVIDVIVYWEGDVNIVLRLIKKTGDSVQFPSIFWFIIYSMIFGIKLWK